MNNGQISVHGRIKRLIEDTDDAYRMLSSGGVNADYAEFAALSLSAFKEALGRPDLTEGELIGLLRQGRARHKSLTPRSCWSSFLAAYIRNRANNSGVAAISQYWRQKISRLGL